MQNIDTSQWQQFKKGRRAFLFVMITYLPAGILIGAIAGGGIKSSLWYLFLLFFWFIWFIISWNRIHKWHCPQCGKVYFPKPPFMHKAFSKNCPNCDFPKWKRNITSDSSGAHK